MQIKTTMRYHLTSVGMAIIKKSTDTEWKIKKKKKKKGKEKKGLYTVKAGDSVEKREPSYTVDGNAN